MVSFPSLDCGFTGYNRSGFVGDWFVLEAKAA
jgi:hypothetical protein